MSKRTPQKPPVAALTLEIKPGQRELLLIPDGEFKSSDGSGRPTEVPAWRMSPTIAERVLARAQSRTAKLVVDYEHQTIRSKENGKPAPAAGRIDRQTLRYEQGVGILGAIDWAPRAQKFIDDGEYAYLSPVFPYDDQTGDVLALMHFALTNDPGLDGLNVAALSAAYADFSTEEEPHMTLLQKLLASLGLADNTGEEEALTAVAALKAKTGEVDGLNAKVAALTVQVSAPDPAKFVPVATLTALQAEHATAKSQLVALQAEVAGGKLEKTIEEGLASGKLTPATEPWARDLGKRDFAALTAFLTAAPVVIKPGETQTQGKGESGGDGASGLSSEQVAVCSALGLSHDQFKAANKGG